VLSYTTSPAYHLEKEKSDAYATIAFPDGAYRQVETAALLKNAPHAALGKKFLEMLLSPEVQAEVPTRQWMYPARAKTPLPASFKSLTQPKAIAVRPPVDEKARHALLDRWLKVSVP
jgi:thiamine transport system substrate-binding protein